MEVDQRLLITDLDDHYHSRSSVTNRICTEIEPRESVFRA